MTKSRRKPRHSSDQTSGSETSEPEFLLIGRLIRPHGVRGEILMKIITDYPERIYEREIVYLKAPHAGGDPRPYDLENVRYHNNGLLVLFKAIPDRSAAETLRNYQVYVHIEEAVPLEEGEYYLFELLNMRVVTDEGQELGHLADVIETGANDVYLVQTPEGKEILLPAIPDVIVEINFETETITVHLLEGLI